MNKTSFKKHNWKTSFEMIIDKKSNLIHIIQYEAKTYSLNKNISRKEKMKSKTHLDFLIKYNSINIFFIWVFNQRKVIRTRNVTFDENVRYRFNEIDLTQLINEFFLINDTLNISRSDFTKITEIESNNEKKIWDLTFTNFITTRYDAIEKTFEKMLNEIEHDYLLSFVSFSSKNENTSNDFDIVSKTSTSTSSSSTFEKTTRVFASSTNKTKKLKHWEKTTTINENNILLEEISRSRKSNSFRNFNHYVVLKNVFAEKIRSFYETFATSMQKKKRSHRNDFLTKFKFYHQMLKHSKIVDFLRVISVEIKALQSKQTWKKMFWSHVKKAKKTFIFTTWVFKYKFDNDDYLMKHKIRLCARKNLQQTKQNVYAVTLIIKIFRAFMIIIIVFDLNIR